MSQKIIAVANQKGGVGKTTTSVNVAAGLAAAGNSVLIVDLDPQGNASSGLGVDASSGHTMYDVLINGASLADTVRETATDNLYILPSNNSLVAAEVDLVDQSNREHQLQHALASGGYDVVIIDCPPALGLLTINALTAASHVLIPVQTEYYALEGLGQLLGTIQRVRGQLNTSLELLGVVLTMYDKRTSLSEQVRTEVEKHFGDKLFESVIPRNVSLAEAPSYGETIYEHDKWSKGSRSYKSLSKEVSSRLSL